VREKIGWNRSAARFKSDNARSKNRLSPDDDAARPAISSSYAGLFRIAWSKMVGLEVSPVIESSLM
jgi:hypothetical protein